VGVGCGVWGWGVGGGGGGGGELRYMECNGENCMLGVIPTGHIFMSSYLCITLLACNSCPTLFIVTYP